jgi:hypothetical protein
MSIPVAFSFGQKLADFSEEYANLRPEYPCAALHGALGPMHFPLQKSERL